MRFDFHMPVFIALLVSGFADVLSTGMALRSGAVESNPLMYIFGSSVIAICLTAWCIKVLFAAGVCFLSHRWQKILAISVGGAQIGMAMHNMLIAGQFSLFHALMSGVLTGVLAGIYIKNSLEDIPC